MSMQQNPQLYTGTEERARSALTWIVPGVVWVWGLFWTSLRLPGAAGRMKSKPGQGTSNLWSLKALGASAPPG